LTCFFGIRARNLKNSSNVANPAAAPQSSHQITLRFFHRVFITNNMRVWFKTRTFERVAPLNPDEANNKLVLLVAEINSSAQKIRPVDVIKLQKSDYPSKYVCSIVTQCRRT
jgi:hypothetical protein